MRITIVIFSLLLFSLFSRNAYADTLKESGRSARLVPTVQSAEPDFHAKILKEFLDSYNSPLADAAQTFVREADAYNLDWRLVASISGVESTFGKFCVGTYNCWGWGVYGDNAIYFSSYNEAIQTITKVLRENYMDKWGAQDVYQIGRYYAASPTWASRVVYFMDKIDEFAAKTSSLSISL